MSKLRELREASGKQQKDIAIDLGVSQPTVSDWESGRKTPSATSTRKLADYFGCSIDYLLGRDEKGVPAPMIESGHSKEAIEFARAHPDLTNEEWAKLEEYALLLLAAKKANAGKKAHPRKNRGGLELNVILWDLRSLRLVQTPIAQKQRACRARLHQSSTIASLSPLLVRHVLPCSQGHSFVK